MQPVIPLKLTHYGLLPLVVLAVAGHAAVKADAVCKDVDVFVLGVGVPSHQKLIFFEAHCVHITLPDFPPLVVGELFAGGCGQGNMQNRLAQTRAQLANLAELCRQFSRVFA